MAAVVNNVAHVVNAASQVKNFMCDSPVRSHY